MSDPAVPPIVENEWLADASQGATGETYEIRTVADFLGVPESRRRICLREFHSWLTMQVAVPDLIRATAESLGTPIPAAAIAMQDPDLFRWIDDGEATIGFSIATASDPAVRSSPPQPIRDLVAAFQDDFASACFEIEQHDQPWTKGVLTQLRGCALVWRLLRDHLAAESALVSSPPPQQDIEKLKQEVEGRIAKFVYLLRSQHERDIAEAENTFYRRILTALSSPLGPDRTKDEGPETKRSRNGMG